MLQKKATAGKLMQDSIISMDDFSNFLACGAVVRHKGKWHLYSRLSKNTKIGTKLEGLGSAKGDLSGHLLMSCKHLKLKSNSVFIPDFFDLEKVSILAGDEVGVDSKVEADGEIQVFTLDQVDFIRLLDFYLTGPMSLSEEHRGETQNKSSVLICKNYEDWAASQASKDWLAPSFKKFEQVFHHIKNKISEDQLLKAVPAVFETLKWRVNAQDRAYLLRQLADRAPENLWVYGFWNQSGGLLGASPEVLFYMEDQKISTIALAGTKSFNELKDDLEDSKTSLLKDKKENREHDFVVNDIVEQLEKIGKVQMGKKEILKIPKLLHLKTSLTAELWKPSTAREMVRQLHPTAALGIFPRSFGLSWLKKVCEDLGERRSFGAPLTFRLPHGAMESSETWLSIVSIRCLDWNHLTGLARVGSGCGIVEDSHLETEWVELSHKRASVKGILWDL